MSEEEDEPFVNLGKRKLGQNKKKAVPKAKKPTSSGRSKDVNKLLGVSHSQ